MARKYLIVVDVQDDFIYGPLGSREARSILLAVVDYIKEYEGEVIFTKDTHRSNYKNTQEGRFLPVEHCLAYSDGWELAGPLEEMQNKMRWPVYTKGAFGCVNLAIDLRAEYVKQEIEAIDIIGVCTDICVISNALLIKAYLPEVPITVHRDLCAGVTPEKHEAALKTMESCQIIIE